jgi:hypothetical protein
VNRGAPFGLRKEEGRLVPDALEAAIVRELVQEFVTSGGRKKATAAALNAKGYRTRQGAPWSDTAVWRVLRTVAKVGVVSEDLKQRCVALLKDRSQGQGPPTRRSAHYLGGVVHCSCGGRRYLEGRGQAGKFICRGCRGKIPLDKLEELFEESLDAIELSAVELVEALGNNPRAAELTRMLGGALTPVSKVWPVLNATEKGVVVDVAVSRLVVDQAEVTVTFALEPDFGGESAASQARALPSTYDPEVLPDRATPAAADGRVPVGPDKGDRHQAPVSRDALPLLLTVTAAAEVLRTSPKAVYMMAQRGMLAGVVRVGRRLLVRRDEMLDSLDESRALSPTEERR